MTVSYTRKVATSHGLGVFWKLLFRWKGSIYKLVWQNLAVYLVLYSSLSLTYRLLLEGEARTKFEQISVHCQRFADLIPVTFVLGFYVTIVIGRWWDQYKSIPWPDSCCLFISTCLLGHDDRGRLMRRTIARYLVVALIQTLRLTCVQVKKRFPTLTHMSDAGIITENERKIIEDIDLKCIQHPKYWITLVWAGAVVTRARKEGRIKEDFAFQTIIKEINKFRSGCGSLMSYDWISIPLVYTQVVTLAVYTFFLSSLMGRQFLDPSKNIPGHEVDLVVPVFTFLQFFFYMGWLKVAEALINPFGEDDDDYEMNWLIDRNLQVAYLIVDEMHAEHPELVKDQFWDEGVPDELPYTIAAEETRADPWVESTSEVIVSPKQSEFVYHEKYDEDDENYQSDEMDQIIINTTKPAKFPSIQTKDLSTNMLNSLQGKRNESHGSLIHRIFPSTRSSSRVDLQRIESGVSVISNGIKKRRKISKSNFDRNTRKSSHPFLRRIPTDVTEFQQLSESSSTESLEGARTCYEQTAINEVRELMRKDLEYFEGSSNLLECPKNVDRREWEGSQDMLNINEKQRTTNRLKLEQIQEIQSKMMLELDNELNNSGDLKLGVNDDIRSTLQLNCSISEEMSKPIEGEETGRNSRAQPLEPFNSLASLHDCCESNTSSVGIVTITENPMLINFDKTPENPKRDLNLEKEVETDKKA